MTTVQTAVDAKFVKLRAVHVVHLSHRPDDVAKPGDIFVIDKVTAQSLIDGEAAVAADSLVDEIDLRRAAVRATRPVRWVRAFETLGVEYPGGIRIAAAAHQIFLADDQLAKDLEASGLGASLTLERPGDPIEVTAPPKLLVATRKRFDRMQGLPGSVVYEDFDLVATEANAAGKTAVKREKPAVATNVAFPQSPLSDDASGL